MPTFRRARSSATTSRSKTGTAAFAAADAVRRETGTISSSTNVFQAEQSGHLPNHFGELKPQL